MPKRQIPALGAAAKARRNASAGYNSAETITTAIHIRKDAWNLLRAVAFHRAQTQGGRASVSKLIAELVEQHRAELEHEVQ
jgi:hypothetical protein